MARDLCSDCEEFHPGGVGLVDGRCPGCLALFEERRLDTPAESEPTEEPGRRGWWPPGMREPEPAAAAENENKGA